jgi:hypothetical protein
MKSFKALLALVVAGCWYEIPELPPIAEGCTFEGCAACDDGLVCEPTRGCVECRTSADCTRDPDRRICARNRCVECRPDDPGFDVCGPGDSCVEGVCRDDCPCSQCDCDSGVCVDDRCVECSADADCPDERPVCDPVDRACRACLVDAHCTSEDRTRCNSDFECVNCLVSEDCPQPGLCVGGECVAACCEAADCPAASPRCAQDGQCVACATNADCAPLQCDTQGGVCVECTFDTDCAPPKPACVGSVCVECSNTSPCPEPAVCSDSRCVAP